MTRESSAGMTQSSVPRMRDSTSSPAARTSASEPGGPAICSRGGQSVLGGAARKRESRPAEGVEREGEPDRSLSDLEVVHGQRRRDELERRRQQEIDAVQRGLGALGVLGSRLNAALVVGVGHLEAALDLRAHVLAVGVLELGEEVAVDVCDLAHEDDADLAREREVELAAAREPGRRPRAHVRGQEDLRCSSHAIPTSTSSSDSSSTGSKPSASARISSAQPADRARHRPRVVEARREREAALERDEAEARLEADDPAAGRRDPDRAARVGAERGVGEAGGERGRRASARPAGHPAGKRRVRHGSVVGVRRGDPVRELVQVRLSDVRVAGGLEPAHRLGRLRRARARRRRSSRTWSSTPPCRRVLDGEPRAVRDRFRPRQEDPRRRRIGRNPTRGGDW